MIWILFRRWSVLYGVFDPFTDRPFNTYLKPYFNRILNNILLWITADDTHQFISLEWCLSFYFVHFSHGEWPNMLKVRSFLALGFRLYMKRVKASCYNFFIVFYLHIHLHVMHFRSYTHDNLPGIKLVVVFVVAAVVVSDDDVLVFEKTGVLVFNMIQTLSRIY